MVTMLNYLKNEMYLLQLKWISREQFYFFIEEYYFDLTFGHILIQTDKLTALSLSTFINKVSTNKFYPGSRKKRQKSDLILVANNRF